MYLCLETNGIIYGNIFLKSLIAVIKIKENHPLFYHFIICGQINMVISLQMNLFEDIGHSINLLFCH